MNYLAHFFLSGPNPEIMLGNLLEDYLNGKIDHPRNLNLPEDVKVGLRLHRLIDTFTDTFEGLKDCKQLFYPSVGKYASAVLDVLFDHFLIKNWKTFTTVSQEELKDIINSALHLHLDTQPEKMKLMVDSIIQHDWLFQYEFRYGIEKSLRNLSSKITKDHPDLHLALEVMDKHYDFINQVFLAFFKELKSHCSQFLMSYGRKSF